MKQAKISDVKNNLSRYLDLVRKGESVQILDRDIPIARIVSIADAGSKAQDERLLEMERKGLVRLGNPDLLKPLLKNPPPGKGAGVLRSMLKEREESW